MEQKPCDAFAALAPDGANLFLAEDRMPAVRLARRASSPFIGVVQGPPLAGVGLDQPFRPRPKGIASDSPLEGFSELLDLSATGTRQ